MKNKITSTLAFLLFGIAAFAQRTDGTIKSLLKAEQDFTESVAKNGIQSASNAYSAHNAILFRPNPVDIKTYFAAHPSNDKSLNWTPAAGQVSRSGDWGFTTGGYTMQGNEKLYGQYLSVWKAINGKWELVIDIADAHNKPLHPVVEDFKDPKDYYKPQFNGPKQVAAGKEIILTTEKTLSAMLKSHGIGAFGGFLNANARVNFPGYEPIIGKDKIVAFYNSLVDKISFKTTEADKANGGDLAYTYGLATIDYRTDLRESFNYVFIYERQPDHNWNLIQQIYTPAER
jgi:ketosteroid isomerase-like protein